jgi:hypothetical protein
MLFTRCNALLERLGLFAVRLVPALMPTTGAAVLGRPLTPPARRPRPATPNRPPVAPDIATRQRRRAAPTAAVRHPGAIPDPFPSWYPDRPVPRQGLGG